MPRLRSGSWPDPDSTDRIVAKTRFAEANGLRGGDRFHATLDWLKRWLTLTGTVLGPEFIYTIGPGAMMPDDTRFGILWMPDRAVAAAMDMTGAVNDLSLALSAGARPGDVIDRVDVLLDPMAGSAPMGATCRCRTAS